MDGLSKKLKKSQDNINKNPLLLLTGSKKINPLSNYSYIKIIDIINIVLSSKVYNFIEIKFHPNENKNLIKKIKKKYNNKIKIIYNENLNDILFNYELVISDSNTQALFEAINLDKKVLIYDNNNVNLKKYINKNIFFKNNYQFQKALLELNNNNYYFKEIKNNFLSIKPAEAKLNIINKITS
ncbi:hypothetical protein OA492_03675, partial [Pelagibacteraceae bacterium]|nr:hypothetical protein [Pelagibacteraceae bacterium]